MQKSVAMFAWLCESLNMNMTLNLKRGAVVTLAKPAKSLNNQFAAGEQFKFLGWAGTCVRLSRKGDNAKLITTEDMLVGYVAPALAPYVPKPENKHYDSPHSDASGNSRRIVICRTLAGKFSGETAMHMTPAEEQDYNEGCAKLAELYPG
jgi:hypothetical protein